MRTHEIHRLPVADSRGRLVGILSLSDVVNHSCADSAAPDAVEIAATISAIRRRRKPAELAASVSSNGDVAPARESTKAPKKAPARRRKQG
jgi:CBS domain-containing protein